MQILESLAGDDGVLGTVRILRICHRNHNFALDVVETQGVSASFDPIVVAVEKPPALDKPAAKKKTKGDKRNRKDEHGQHQAPGIAALQRQRVTTTT